MDKKKLTLPIKIIIIGFIIGLVVAGIGGVRELNANKTNKQRSKDAYKQAYENKEKLEKRYAEIIEELKPLKAAEEQKNQECDSMSMSDSNWFTNHSKCQRELSDIEDKINDLETEKFKIENYDNTVYYQKVKPMSYQIFYIIGASIAGVSLLGAFIIYLVKGKKTYN